MKLISHGSQTFKKKGTFNGADFEAAIVVPNEKVSARLGLDEVHIGAHFANEQPDEHLGYFKLVHEEALSQRHERDGRSGGAINGRGKYNWAARATDFLVQVQVVMVVKAVTVMGHDRRQGRSDAVKTG